MSQGIRNRPEALWDRVQIGAPDDCWPWQGGLATGGYGLISVDGRNWRTHRLAYQLATGTDPGDLLVCHSCDNPPCCNPAHLFLGTAHDNTHDALRKGRLVKVIGLRHGNARLTDAQVREIRRRHADGEHHAALASEYGISRSHLFAVSAGRARIHVPKEAREVAA